MKQFAEITYDKIDENADYDELINKVVSECFEVENMSDMSLYLSITLTNNEVIKEINNEYRNIDKATDVLSFPMFEKNELDEMIAQKYEHEEPFGDLIISIPRVEEQAIEYGHSFERELSYMIVHGFYHCMGYDHLIDSDKVVMREKEDFVLNKLNITRD